MRVVAGLGSNLSRSLSRRPRFNSVSCIRVTCCWHSIVISCCRCSLLRKTLTAMEQNVPKSVLERLNVMDEKEYRQRERLAQKKCQDAMERIDWHMMDGHLNSPEARQAYNEICNQLRVNFLEIPRFLGYKVSQFR
ncbi:hypothetical protein F0562_027471 [Nyssa sinensis]|uniref:Uncharacterized protein n=1 Tax=Nyssa sinensis TaxID=561372 RepID=A0A5J5B5H2_9ASTE|nr:hypothetical protein F0562_027471 [Nyssa sinensis]